MSKRVGLIGLGAIGLPVGKRLLGAGHDLTVVPHVNREPAEELAALGAKIAGSPRDLTGDCEVLVTSLPDVPQVREVLFGDGGFANSASTGQLHIDLSTITPSAAQEFHSRLAEQGIASVDAPVSGGPTRAADGTLTIMVGGDEAAFDRAAPILSALGSSITRVGGPGSGQAVKLVNQLMISVIMLANAEALTLGVKAGVPLETLTSVISTASGANGLLQHWLPKTLFTGDVSGGFALDLLMKDLSAALSWAAELKSPTFGGAIAQQLYRLAQLDGHGRHDYSSVATVYEQAAGVELRMPRAKSEDKQ
ncbi:MAG TPA: NAD(P)-dependent oxidoreductase [Chloroflexia bacterium]|nr:NAD(P)-dependent oxidoreductase [Chloroflexia bacterium]